MSRGVALFKKEAFASRKVGLTLLVILMCSSFLACGGSKEAASGVKHVKQQGDSGHEQQAGSGSVAADEGVQAAAEGEDNGQPEIIFDQTEFDFGEVDQGEKVVHIFTFKNTGNGELVIEKVRSSCGCTGALATTKDVLPGGVGVIKATFNSRGYSGSMKKTVTVETNDPKNRTLQLALMGKVTTEVAITPRYVNFGSIRKDDPRKSVDLEIQCRKEKKIRIKDVRSENPAVIVTREKGDDEEATDSISLAEQIPIGRVNGEILIQTTSKKNPQVKVPVYAFIQGNVRVFPQLLSLGIVSPGGPVTRQLILTKPGQEEFHVQEIRKTSDRLTAEVIPEKEGERYRVEVTYDPGDQKM